LLLEIDLTVTVSLGNNIRYGQCYYVLSNGTISVTYETPIYSKSPYFGNFWVTVLNSVSQIIMNSQTSGSNVETAKGRHSYIS